MTAGYRLARPWQVVAGASPTRYTLQALDGSVEVVLSGVAQPRWPAAGQALSIEELRSARPGGRAILLLREAQESTTVETESWWVHEKLPNIFNDLNDKFKPSRGSRWIIWWFITLLAIPGMPRVVRWWHGRRTTTS